jgi:hypothetical protein
MVETIETIPPPTARTGHYLGTEIEGKWWHRYRKRPFFARGNGVFWYDHHALYFLKYLTRHPLVIPFAVITACDTGRWHAGRWCFGFPILKIAWKQDRLLLISGFFLTRKRTEIEILLTEINQRRHSAVSEPTGSRKAAGLTR